MGNVVSVFCGCGGLDWGFRELGFDLVYACDNDPAAADCYARNIDANVVLRDVRSREFHSDIEMLPHCDVVLGGFPCQGFSKAGPKEEQDDRNLLYLEMKQVVRRLRPRLFLAENVDGLSQNFGGVYLKRIVADFWEVGYKVEHRVFDAASFGVPQYRRRIFFVGVPRNSPDFIWPDHTHKAKTRNGEFKVASNLDLFDAASGTPTPRLLRAVPISAAIGDLLDLDERTPDHSITRSWPKEYEIIFGRIKEGQKLCNVRHAPSSVYTWQIPEVFGEVTDRERKVLETISRHRRHKRYGNIPNGNPLAVAEVERLAETSGLRPEINQLLEKGYLKDVGGKYDLKGAMFCSGLFKRPSWDDLAQRYLQIFTTHATFFIPSATARSRSGNVRVSNHFPTAFTSLDLMSA